MAQKPIDPKKVHEIYELFQAGSTIAEISQKLGTNRETIRQYLLRVYTPKQKRAIVLRNRRDRRWLQLSNYSADSVRRSRGVKG